MENTASGSSLGMAILKALDIDHSCVTGLTMDCEAGEFAQLTVRRHIKGAHECQLVMQIEKYRVESIDAFTVESERLTPQLPTTLDRPAGSQGFPS